MNSKYKMFIELLKFNTEKYSVEKVFKDFISLFAISLSNKVYYNKLNSELYKQIIQSYDKEEQFHFYTLSAELTKLFCNETDPYDVLGEIYRNITKKETLKLTHSNYMQEVGRKLKGVVNINQKTKNGRIVEMDCGSGAMILAYASTLKIFKLDYKFDLEVAALDTDAINVFMTYIQLYFFEISAVVILLDEKTNTQLMRLYTPSYEHDVENLMVA